MTTLWNVGEWFVVVRVRAKEGGWELILSPRWGFSVSHFSHGLRRGLHSNAAFAAKSGHHWFHFIADLVVRTL